MKNNTLLVYLGYLLLSGLLIFSGCIPKKEILPRTGTYTFYNYYYDNLGTVTVTVDGNNIKSFSNTSDYCDYGSSYSSYYYTLNAGTHTYKAQSSDLTKFWSGSFTVYDNSCGSTQFDASSSTSTPLTGSTGKYTFYTTYSDYLGTITVTVDGTNVKTFSNTSDYCGYSSYSSYSSYFYTLNTGSHTYVAKTSDLTKSWSGSFTVSTGGCGSSELSASNSTTIPGATGSNTITDSGGIKIDLSWSLPGTSYPTTYADLELQLEYSSGGNYSSSTSSSSFESINFPLSGTASSLSNGTYYVSIRPYSISSSYSYANYSVKFTGINTGVVYTYNSTTPFYYSSSSYTKFVKIVKSGSTFTLSLY